MKLLLALLFTTQLWAATIYTPGTYEWTAYFSESQFASGVISWDNERYTMATTQQAGPFGFSGALADQQYHHRLTLVFTAPTQAITLQRLVSFVPPGLGYLPYGHLYGGYWPPDIPQFIGCDEPWRLALAANCHECKSVAPPIEPDSATPEVPEPGSWALLGAALIGLALLRRSR